MLSIKRHVPSKLSLIRVGLSAKSYIVETAASLRRRVAGFRSRHDYVGRKSLMGGGALLMGFFGSIYVLFALQPQSAPKVATPVAAKPASSQTTASDKTPVTGNAASPNGTDKQQTTPAAAPTLSSNSASPSQAPSYASGVATPAPSLVTSPSVATPAPVASEPTVQPGMGSTAPSAPTTTTNPIETPPAPDPIIPSTTVTGPITTLQQTVLPNDTEPLVSPMTNTIDRLIQ